MLMLGVVSMRTFDWMEMFARSAKWSIGFVLICSLPIAGYSWWRRKQSKALRVAAEQTSPNEAATAELHPSLHD